MTENEFWDLTLGEIARRLDSYQRVKERNQKEKASYDYIQATLIAKLVGKVLGDKSETPKIEDVYPTLFKEEVETEEEQTQSQSEKDAIAFMTFVQQFNKKFEGGNTEQ